MTVERRRRPVPHPQPPRLHVARRSARALGADRATASVVRGGRLPSLRIAPGETLDVELDAAGRRRRALRHVPSSCAGDEGGGHEVAWQQLRSARAAGRRPTPAAGRGRRTALDRARSSRTLIARAAARCSSGARRPTTTVCRWSRTRPYGPLQRWLELGLDRIELELVSERPGELVHRAPGIATHTHSYRVLADGGCWSRTWSSSTTGVHDLPRVGVVMMLRPGLEQLEWYGRGPWEAYSDRRASTTVGALSQHGRERVRALHAPAGARPPPGRALARGSPTRRGRGLEVRGRPTIGFGASHFTAADLTAANHTNELAPRAEVDAQPRPRPARPRHGELRPGHRRSATGCSSGATRSCSSCAS